MKRFNPNGMKKEKNKKEQKNKQTSKPNLNRFIGNVFIIQSIWACKNKTNIRVKLEELVKIMHE